MKQLFVITFIVIVLLISWQVANFKLFSVERTSLCRHKVGGRNFSLDITRVSAGATTDDVIQISKLYDDGSFEVVQNLEDYNNFVGSGLIGDSLLKLVVRDTGSYEGNADTILVKI